MEKTRSYEKRRDYDAVLAVKAAPTCVGSDGFEWASMNIVLRHILEAVPGGKSPPVKMHIPNSGVILSHASMLMKRVHTMNMESDVKAICLRLLLLTQCLRDSLFF